MKDEKSLESWQGLFRDRRAWAIELAESCDRLVKELKALDTETSVVRRATVIAVGNIKQHVGSLHQKYEEANSWARNALQDQESLLKTWEAAVQNLSNIPARRDLGALLRSYNASQRETVRSSGENFTLQEIVDLQGTKEAADIGQGVFQYLTDHLETLTRNFEDIIQNSSDLIDNLGKDFSSTTKNAHELADRLIEEVEVLVKKISSDYEFNLGLPKSSKSVSAISKTALLHTKNFLPSLVETSSDIDKLLDSTVTRKRDVVKAAVRYLRKISTVESTLADIQPQLAGLDIGAEGSQAFDMISFATNIPTIYGSLLVEAVRRREWREKLTADTATLAEELAVHKEEEEKRRRRWLKSLTDYVDPELVDSKALGVEVNVQTQERQWPRVERQEIQDYIQQLRNLRGFDETIKEIAEMVKSLDSPSKQQARRAKAFKKGSIHEAANLGRNSLFLRGDDDLFRSLQSDKSRLEDRLKGSESRIRKLEDLLHRQSQIQKPLNTNVPSTNNPPGIERHATSPVLNYVSSSPKTQDNLSRRSSVSSRRFSANHGMEEKALAQRIVKLEAELGSERAQSVGLQEAAAEKAKLEQDLKAQVQEASAIKSDLMGNLDAQQREFEDERRLLEGENGKLKLKLEEVEDELDRILESRDNEKTTVDERVHIVELELEKVRRDAAEEVEKAQGQVEFMQNDYTMQREKANRLEREARQREEENADLQVKLKESTQRLQLRDKLQKDFQKSLNITYAHLSDGKDLPGDYGDLVGAIEALATRSAYHREEIKQALEQAQQQNAAFETRIQEHDDRTHDLEEQLNSAAIEALHAKEDLSEQRERFDLLEKELGQERQELGELQSRFAKGETGSEALKSRLSHQEQRVEQLSSAIAIESGHKTRLEDELSHKINELEEVRESSNLLATRLGTRSARSEDVSKRLYMHVERLSRLLELIGFTVAKQGNTPAIQRAAKTTTGSTMLSEGSQYMKRSSSGPLPTKVTSDEDIDSSYLSWTAVDDEKVETERFNTYLQHVEILSTDTFSEAVLKRIKESEHTARKWQREAKSYREKTHRAQSEAHEKIAFRSFKEGDLALFLPTRNQATRPWAAFNVGAPHYFLREQDSHKLRTRDWLLARISKVEERVVDLSRSINGLHPPSDRQSIGEASDGGASFDDENPFELSDGLRWYLIDAAEEKPGAPSTPGPSKSTVAAANVDAKGSVRMKKSSNANVATRTLTKSLDSRRSSSNSKKGLAVPSGAVSAANGQADITTQNTVDNGGRAVQPDIDTQRDSEEPPRDNRRPMSSEEQDVRKDLLWGP